MSIAVIASLGTSSPAVTSYFKVCGHEIPHLTILSNQNQEVRSHAILIKTGLHLSPEYQDTQVEIKELSHNDVVDPIQCNDFLKMVAETIVELRRKYDTIYLNAAGGRKTMTILLGLIAQLQLVDGLFHVIAKDQTSADRRSYELKDIIRPFSTLITPPDQEKHYQEHLNDFEDYLFPSVLDFELVRILTLPIDRVILRDIVSDLLNNYPGFDARKKIHYEESGFIEEYEGGWKLTGNGKGFLEAVRPALEG